MIGNRVRDSADLGSDHLRFEGTMERDLLRTSARQVRTIARFTGFC